MVKDGFALGCKTTGAGFLMLEETSLTGCLTTEEVGEALPGVKPMLGLLLAEIEGLI